MDMKSYLTHKLSEVTTAADKNMLRDVLENIFLPLYDHVEGQYAELERRVKDQVSLSAEQFVVWTTVMERTKASGGCPYLFPMISADLENPPIALLELRQTLELQKEAQIDTVFLAADYLVCKKAAESGTVFTGFFKTEEQEIQIEVKLRPSQRHMRCIEELYRLFITNTVPWHTIYSPYLFKLFDVILVRMDAVGKDLSANVQKMQVSYGDLQQYIQHNMVPIWNIQKKQIKSEDFPLAAQDKVNYEYVFGLDEDAVDTGYLADYESADISAVRREKHALIVTSPTPKGLTWDMYLVIPKKDYATDFFTYEPLSNGQADSFASRMASYYGTVIKTRAELTRILHSFAASQWVELDSYQIVNETAQGESYEVNRFLSDEVRDLAVSKSLVLKFRGLRDSFIARDAMSFLTSQIQLFYPEFHCVGVLV